jgi:hypothetical protein
LLISSQYNRVVASVAHSTSAVYRLVVAGFISRASRPGSTFNRLSVSRALELMYLKMVALVSSPRELQNSLSFAFIRPLEHKLWQYRSCKAVRVSHPGFWGLTPWFFGH